MEIRNIAIIAHVDHGKTTLMDAIMKQVGVAKEGFSMDSNALEQERGITIYAKNASITYKDTKINIVDTPGHADFGSEVERVLRSIDTVLLLVDAQEGPMPQTRFVLKKSLELGMKPIVLINKIDKPAARPKEVMDEILELFIELGATDEQLDFTTIYSIGRQGIAKRKLEDESTDLCPLLDTIIELVPPAKSDTSAPLRMQPFNLAYDSYTGRLGLGRIYEGTIKVGQNVTIKKPTGEVRIGKVTKLYTFEGLDRKEVNEAGAGDIAMVAGLPDIFIGETICENADQEPLHAINVDEPTIALNFLVNNSPFAGREGKFVTTRQIRERLEKELEVNVGLRIDFNPPIIAGQPDTFKVFGRGELHVSVLLENMRREGFELQVSQPQVIIKEIEGIKSEPFEEVIADVRTEFSGEVIRKLSVRKGIMTNMTEREGITRLTFEIPTRGLLGYRGEFVIDTKGEGILSARFIEFRPHVGIIEKHEFGSMVSMENGEAVGFALWNLQERGVLYIGAGVPVYAGMILGNTSKGEDLEVNPTKGKVLSNYRSAGKDDAISLIPPFSLTIERGLEIMHEDDYLEITPESVRLRKKLLTANDRSKAKRS
ncbi:MAG: translational GTPase TypA [Candidatus Taylorbacteria bacterium CG10_big_fil_rev_8_21_14_0_10_41_48]|uniref:50S ribosomal subunit assembly factor BipA n=1 Tax=Candidatus Taylorbacteria bacterium CG10_big_fil_rev_8_21_14_0_10_41_48 TaxID=1975024 RepID=A0A2M8LBQ8_9BACT|nr:MAG: translational GTPase TypA [Candidatus Taylorbacteria bacterium CG10_big_fil_rev_8_21_14_0_10_41_48]